MAAAAAMAADLPGRYRDNSRCSSVGVCCLSPDEVGVLTRVSPSALSNDTSLRQNQCTTRMAPSVICLVGPFPSFPAIALIRSGL